MGNSEDERGESAVYEISYLILPSLPEDKLADTVYAIKKIIAEEGGIEINSEAPFKHPLAYPMSKTIGASRYLLSDAYLGWIKFDLSARLAETTAQRVGKAGAEHPIEVIKKGIGKIGEVVRFLLAKAPRETVFTFAKARAAAEEKEKSESSPAEEVVIN